MQHRARRTCHRVPSGPRDPWVRTYKHPGVNTGHRRCNSVRLRCHAQAGLLACTTQVLLQVECLSHASHQLAELPIIVDRGVASVTGPITALAVLTLAKTVVPTNTRAPTHCSVSVPLTGTQLWMRTRWPKKLTKAVSGKCKPRTPADSRAWKPLKSCLAALWALLRSP